MKSKIVNSLKQKCCLSHLRNWTLNNSVRSRISFEENLFLNTIRDHPLITSSFYFHLTPPAPRASSFDFCRHRFFIKFWPPPSSYFSQSVFLYITKKNRACGATSVWEAMEKKLCDLPTFLVDFWTLPMRYKNWMNCIFLKQWSF